jgi:hypothetical protein
LKKENMPFKLSVIGETYNQIPGNCFIYSNKKISIIEQNIKILQIISKFEIRIEIKNALK